MTMKMRLIPFSWFLVWMLSVGSALAVDPINTGFLNDLALKGYDPVAYFSESKPVKGDKAISTKWNGATWRFSSEANQRLFIKDPQKYAPQYGGYCAWAVGNGYTADIDPKAWTVHDGKLYLNYNRNVRNDWLADKASLIKKGDFSWPELRDQ